MQKLLLLGDEAIAQGALDAGITGVYAYPGTPSTEVTEYIQHSKLAKEKGIHCTWSANEKTAMEEAIGVSYTGRRALVCMKHVGLNVAADPFTNSAVTGANGGLVYLIADDPSMHSSQDEQDSRYYARFAQIPCLEPSNQQEAYDMIRYAFDLSEKLHTPVLFRVTTRMAHSRSGVELREARGQNEIKLDPNPKRFILLPANARVLYRELLAKQKDFEACALNDGFNRYEDGSDKSLGIIACGIGYNYLMENYANGKCPHPVLKISQYPIPRASVKQMMDECGKVLVVEEGYPIYEELIRGYLDESGKILGRLRRTDSRRGGGPPAFALQRLPARRFLPRLERSDERLRQGPCLCRYRMLYPGRAASLQRDLLHRGHGRIHHDGQRRGRFRLQPGGCRHRRLHFHPFGHDRFAGCGQRQDTYHRDDPRQLHHRHDRRTGFGGFRQDRIHLHGLGCRKGTHPRDQAAQEPSR